MFRPLVSTAAGIIFLSTCQFKWVEGYILTALIIGAVVCFGFTVVLVVLMLWDKRLQSIDTMGNFASSLKGLTDEQMEALGMQFPSMRYHMRRGEVREYWEDTQVEIETFKLFLQDSNERYIAPRRNWYTAERPERAWVEIKSWLEEHGKIIPDSAAGPASWLWSGNSYRALCAYWLKGRGLVNMTDPSYQYALDEDEPLPHLKRMPEEA